jgi:hypothetical protein
LLFSYEIRIAAAQTMIGTYMSKKSELRAIFSKHGLESETTLSIDEAIRMLVNSIVDFENDTSYEAGGSMAIYLFFHDLTSNYLRDEDSDITWSEKLEADVRSFFGDI